MNNRDNDEITLGTQFEGHIHSKHSWISSNSNNFKQGFFDLKLNQLLSDKKFWIWAHEQKPKQSQEKHICAPWEGAVVTYTPIGIMSFLQMEAECF